jgi:hypothetical protein
MMRLLLVAGFSLALVLPSAWAQVSVINDQKYIGDESVFHIVGEVENTSFVPLNQITIAATFYSSDGKILDTKNTDSILETIMPGKKSPFDLIINERWMSEIDHYSLDIKYTPTDHKTESLEVLSSHARLDMIDNFVISGTIVNHDEKTANNIVVVATLYDRDGKVVATSKTYTKPDYLKSGAEAPFLLSVSDKSQTRKISDYSLTVESEEYTAVPEFPIGSAIVLASSVVAYLILTRKPELVIAGLSRVTRLR